MSPFYLYSLVRYRAVAGSFALVEQFHHSQRIEQSLMNKQGGTRAHGSWRKRKRCAMAKKQSNDRRSLI